MANFTLLDNDAAYGERLRRALKRYQVEVDHVRRWSEPSSADAAPDLYLLELAAEDPHGVYWAFGGLTVAREIRRRVGRATPIWVLTQHDDPNIERECRRQGVDRVMFKSRTVDNTAYDVAHAWRRAQVAVASARLRRGAREDFQPAAAALVSGC